MCYKTETHLHTSESSRCGRLTAYIDKNVSFKKRYAGHFRGHYDVDDLHTIIYNEAVELE